MPNSTEDPEDRRRKVGTIFLWIVITLVAVLIIGIIGFKYIVNLSWIDAIHNAAFYTSGMGPVASMDRTVEKLFASIYALIAGLLFVAVAAYLIDQLVTLEFFRVFTS